MCSCILERIRDTRMGQQAIAVPAKKKVLWTLDWDTKQLLFLHTGKYYGHFNGTPSDICFCTLESIGDTIMGQQAKGVPAH